MRKNNRIAAGLMTAFTAAALFAGCSNSAGVQQNAANDAQKYVQAPARVSKVAVASNGVQTAAGDIQVTETVPAQQSSQSASSDTVTMTNRTQDSTSDESRPVLEIGEKNEAVADLQKELIELGYLKGYTGYFGTDTQEALEEFQQVNHLTVDGIAGDSTWDVLLSGSAIKAG